MKKFLKWLTIFIGSIVVLVLIYAAVTLVRHNRFGLYASGGPLLANQSAFDVTFYDISLHPDAEKKFLSGKTGIEFKTLKNGLTEIQLHLINNFTVSEITDKKGNSLEFTHENGLISIPLKHPLMKNEMAGLQIVYAGEAPEAIRPPWIGGINWSKDADGNDWIGLSCQGEGGKIWFPCKDHPSDEADSVFLHITVPEPYFCAANGLLDKVESNKGSLTYHWKTHYPINNYNINFAIGMYEAVESEYITETGATMPVVFYVLPQSREGAEKHVAMAIDMLQSYRKFYGEYPFTKEKFGLVETDYLGMEHQTINAYGNHYKYETIFNSSEEFDGLMLHEMGHEWWGNKVTVKDWSHFWIQEGICSYGEALYQLDKSGEDAYHKKMAQIRRRIRNKNPIVIHANATTTESYNGDIYSKGAYLMHTLRYVLGDSIFFPVLKQFATDSAYTYQNFVDSEDLIQLVNRNSGEDYRKIMELYLKTTILPEVKIDSVGINRYKVSIPNIGFSLPMEVTMGEKKKRMQLGKKAIEIISDAWPVVDEKGWYLKNGDLR